MAKLNFKDVQSQSATLLTTMRGGSFASIYVLMGPEPYFIDLIADFITDNALAVAERDFNQVILYGKETSANAVITQARRYPMMSARQVVVVRQAQFLSDLDALAHYVVNPLESTILVICHKDKSIDKRSQLYKKLAASGAIVVESVAPRDYEIGGWITEMVKSKGCAIEPKAVAMLSDFVGADLSKIENEIDKLLTRLDQGTTNITADHIEQNIGISKEYNNFELTRAISARDVRSALAIAEHFAANPKDNPLVVTMSVLFNHFQRIVTLNIYRWESRRKKVPMGSEAQIATLLGLSHPFFVREYLAAADNYPNAKAFAILGLIREFEMKGKGMGAGSMDHGELLKELLLRIAIA